MVGTYRCILCFVVQRDDATSFTISNKDMIYKKVVMEAIEKGVEVMAIQVKWGVNGTHHYIKAFANAQT
jgi:DNA-binding sugar fermentation-stimulating protein